MAQRRFHYEKAFEHYLRANRVPYVAVDEARKALLPHPQPHSTSINPPATLKNFDFVVYGPAGNLIVDVKGRLFGSSNLNHCDLTRRRLENWVTRDDIDSLTRWQQLFGPGFTAAFIFIYALAQQPPDALFEELFEFDSRWYALRSISLADYARFMTLRSRSWGTVHLPSDAFNRLSSPFSIRAASQSCRPLNAAVC